MNAAQRESLRQAGYCNCEDASDGEIRDMLDAARKDMSIEEAVAVLNERRHNGFAKWLHVADDVVRGEGQYEYLSQFEAIAVAEKYQREAE